jgi:hypothetical protein
VVYYIFGILHSSLNARYVTYYSVYVSRDSHGRSESPFSVMRTSVDQSGIIKVHENGTDDIICSPYGYSIYMFLNFSWTNFEFEIYFPIFPLMTKYTSKKLLHLLFRNTQPFRHIPTGIMAGSCTIPESKNCWAKLGYLVRDRMMKISGVSLLVNKSYFCRFLVNGVSSVFFRHSEMNQCNHTRIYH